jgi:hypothetical protein
MNEREPPNRPTIVKYTYVCTLTRLPNPSLDKLVSDSLHPLDVGMDVVGEDVCEFDPACAVHEVCADAATGPAFPV